MFGTSAADGVTIVIVASTMILVAVAATYWPASRAAAVDPMVALRQE